MTLKSFIAVFAVVLVIFFIVYDVIALYSDTFWRPFLFLEIALFSALLVVFVIFRYDRHIWSFFEWMSRPRVKPPAFSCVRCQSLRVIIHERREANCIRRIFWCKDCGYEWSNIALDTKETESGEVEPRKNHVQ